MIKSWENVAIDYCIISRVKNWIQVGFGGSPDESGETTLDAMIMDGRTLEVFFKPNDYLFQDNFFLFKVTTVNV
jgi:hypothetical protein